MNIHWEEKAIKENISNLYCKESVCLCLLSSFSDDAGQTANFKSFDKNSSSETRRVCFVLYMQLFSTSAAALVRDAVNERRSR